MRRLGLAGDEVHHDEGFIDRHLGPDDQLPCGSPDRTKTVVKQKPSPGSTVTAFKFSVPNEFANRRTEATIICDSFELS